MIKGGNYHYKVFEDLEIFPRRWWSKGGDYNHKVFEDMKIFQEDGGGGKDHNYKIMDWE